MQRITALYRITESHGIDPNVNQGRKWHGRIEETYLFLNPKGSMYGLFTYIWLMFMVNVGRQIPVPWMLMSFLLKMVIFHCYVSLPEGKSGGRDSL